MPSIRSALGLADDFSAFRQPGLHLHRAAEVAPDHHRPEMDRRAACSAAVQHQYLRSTRSHHQRRRGHDQRRNAPSEMQMHLRVHAWNKNESRVRDVDLREHRARRGVERPRRARHVTDERPVRYLLDGHVGRQPRRDGWRIGLRHRDVRANRVRLGQAKQAAHRLRGGAARRDRRSGAAVGADQRTDVHVAGGDHPGERRGNMREPLHLGQPANVRFGRRRCLLTPRRRLLSSDRALRGSPRCRPRARANAPDRPWPSRAPPASARAGAAPVALPARAPARRSRQARRRRARRFRCRRAIA